MSLRFPRSASPVVSCIPTSVAPVAFVYAGAGAGQRSVRSAVETLQKTLPSGFEVSCLTASELLRGQWAQRAALLVMPGMLAAFTLRKATQFQARASVGHDASIR